MKFSFSSPHKKNFSIYSRKRIFFMSLKKKYADESNQTIRLTDPMSWGGGVSRYIGPGPGEPRRARDSLKGIIDVSFYFV